MSKSIEERIAELTAKIEAYAELNKIKRAKLVAQFPALGSARTFADMVDGKYDGYNLEAQEANLLAVATLIDDLGASAGPRRKCDTLATVRALQGAVLATLNAPEDEIARVVLVRGASGAGKTTAAQIIAGRYGSQVVMLEADESMSNSPAAFLGAVLAALGKSAPGASASARMGATVAALANARRCVIIDEAHHLGIRNLNILKSLVNQTRCAFALLAIPKLWSNLEKDAYQEALQLTTNRLAECVTFAPDAADIARLLAFARPDLFADESAARQAAQRVAEFAPGRGNMAFARDVARALAFDPAERDKEEAPAISAAIQIARRKRGES